MTDMTNSNLNINSKLIKVDDNGNKVYPEGTVFTRLKFCKSKRTGLPIGFVSQNPVNKRIKGVREDSEYPKTVCVVDAPLASDIILDVLYKVAIVPMKNKIGYIVIEAEPHQFRASIEISYIPKACYCVDVKFGNKTIRFDPMDGRKDSMRTLNGCRALLEKRLDIANLNEVLDEFVDAAQEIIKRFRKDGFYYKAS